jgi:hypothetical protein
LKAQVAGVWSCRTKYDVPFPFLSGEAALLKTFASVTALAAALAFTAPSYAQEIMGVIREYQPTQRIVILEDGTKLSLSEGVTIQQYQPGMKVRYVIEDRGGTRYITKIITAE